MRWRTLERRAPATIPGYVFGRDELDQPVQLDVGPHALIGGISGSGKSVVTRAILMSAMLDDGLGLVGFDPKRVELGTFRPRFAMVTTGDAGHAALAAGLVELMDTRYRLMAALGIDTWSLELGVGPRVMVVLAELSALMAPVLDPDVIAAGDDLRTAIRVAKADAEVRTLQLRLLGQQARAAGIQLLADTQRPSAENIDGDFRSNMGARLCLKVMNAYTAEMVLGDLPDGGPRPWEELTLAHPGIGYYDNGRTDHLVRCRSTFHPLSVDADRALSTSGIADELGPLPYWIEQAAAMLADLEAA